MTFGIIYFVWRWTQNIAFELLVYKIIDFITTNYLETKSDPTERKLIWLYESAAILVCCALFSFHHPPYLLILLLSLTLMYTQLPIGESIRHLWHTLKGSWDDFEQHSECLEQNQPLPASQADILPTTGLIAQQPVGMTAAPIVGTVPISGRPPITNISAAVVVTSLPPITSTSHIPPASTSDQRPSSVISNQPMSVPADQVSNLLANPSAPISNPPKSSLPNEPLAEQTGKWAQTKDVMRRARAAFSLWGSGPVNLSAPPGLHNYAGQNLCFINAIMQCLSRTPSFTDDLIALRSATRPSYVNHLANLFEGLTSPGRMFGASVLDTASFRTSVCARSRGLIMAPYTQRQLQQDAAEFLSWLLAELHTSLNGATQPLTGINVPPQNGGHQPNGYAHTPVSLRQYALASISRLRQSYSHPTPQTITLLRNNAINQIEAADGYNGRSYIGPMVTLSDIDRLIHAASNNSVVDDLFTGQIIDARLCDACRRIAASTQLFQLLLVPIANPHDETGIVRLDDCLALFGVVEELTGPNGLNCEHCNRARLNTAVRSRSDPSLSAAASALSPVPNNSRLSAMSPIMTASDQSPNVSDFASLDHRTSTPVPGAPRPTMSVYVTSCKRRSLIANAPPCLIVQLMRFGMTTNGTARKLKTPVAIPTSGLSLTDLLLENMALQQSGRPMRPVLYDLYAVCLHIGGDCTSNGHYISYARCADQRWYRFDDSQVITVDMDYELTTKFVRENAYLLFYRMML